MSFFRTPPKQSPPGAGTTSRANTVSPAEHRPAADPNELLMLRSLFKDLPHNPEPSVISSALGRYASYLSQTKDARVNLAGEFFQSSLAVSADPDPRAVHTYHWFLCSQKKDYRAMTQYERLRARAPIRGEDPAALIAELGPIPASAGAVSQIDRAACLANFLDELCLRVAEAQEVWDQVMLAAKDGGEPLQPFTQGKYASFLLRHIPQRASEARALFQNALANEPDNIEGMVDFASLITATPSLIAQEENVKLAEQWYLQAMAKAPNDTRVLSMYAVFLASPHALCDIDKAETLHKRAVNNDSMCAGALSRYAEFLETQRSDVEGAGELFRRCHEADSLNLLGLLGLAAMKHRAGDSEAGEKLYRQAVEAHPEDANALGALGSFLFSVRQDRDEAGDLLRRAVKLDSGHATNIGNLALFLSEGTDAERREAGEYYERAIALDPGNFRATGRLAAFQERIIGDLPAAEATYRRAIQQARDASSASAPKGSAGATSGADPYLATLLANYSALLATWKSDTQKAGELLRQAVEVDPTNAIVLSMQADYLEHVKLDMEAADQCYNRACLLSPDSPDIMGAYAAFLAHTRGDLELAEEYFCRAIELDRRHAENLGGYAVLLMTLCGRGGDVAALIQRADDCFRIACEEAPENPAHAANYAVFLANIRCELSEAKALFERALLQGPSDVTTLLNYAHFLETCLEDDVLAEDIFQRALAASNHKDARVLGSFALFRCRVHEDSLDENRQLFQDAIDADPTNAPNLAAFAKYMSEALGQHDDADTLFRKALQHAPRDADILGSYGAFVEEVQHDNDAAEVYYRKAIEADPNNATNLGKFAYFLHAVRGDKNMAHAHYERAVQCGNNADILGNFANFLETERDDHALAEQYYKQAVAVDPRHAYNLASYARLLAYQGDHDTADDYFRQAVAADIGDSAITDYYIDFLTSIQESDPRSNEYYKGAIEEFPQCAPLLKSYGEYLDKVLGSSAEAARYYKLASEIVTL